jgi:WD40 repeat protein
VKGLAWNPAQRGLFATGGGVTDGTIRTWSSFDLGNLACSSVGAQVTSILWSPNGKEILFSSGEPYSRIELLDPKTLHHLGTLMESPQRILFLAQSPNGSKVISIGEEESLHYWELFECHELKKESLLSFDLTLR